MSSDNKFDFEAGQGIARILHNVLLNYPTAEMVQGFKEHCVAVTWPEFGSSSDNQAGRNALAAYLSQWSVMQLDELKLDYGQLFFGPGEPTAMPWGSVYLGEQQLLNDKSTVELMAFYKQNGISFDLEYHQPLDHIALYFAVIDQLLGQLAVNPDDESVRRTLSVLLQQHMLPWSQRCFELAIEHSQTDFYLGIAHLALDFQKVLAEVFRLISMPVRLHR
ncbi:molecular chaperone TorD [Shewanella canadensis]|uniref:Molecular chaperone TorD n=1 Tax=Shewanella canadensis TaxID=271096 RepID=A0A3S0IRL3_9GAMM|nr:molecular chaperone TorD family protein [Shewanella canadensis]RTR38131.1 molecular chaperone TorD [Shewanella canadensis]